MKKLIIALIAASVSAISAPSFGADWLYQLEQTRRFQKKAAEKRAAAETKAVPKPRAATPEPKK